MRSTRDTLAQALGHGGREFLRRRAAAALGEEGENEERKGEHEREGENDARLQGGSPGHEKMARGGLEGRRRRGGVHGVGASPPSCLPARGGRRQNGSGGLGLMGLAPCER